MSAPNGRCAHACWIQVAVETSDEQRSLAAKGVVNDRLAELHRIHKIAHGCVAGTVRPEASHRGVYRYVCVEFARLGQSRSVQLVIYWNGCYKTS
jgi:hypothetical protein